MTLAGWTDFFVAELGAASALIGFVIVGISINVSRILSHPRLPGRAAETLVAPTGVLVAASFGLVPAQPQAVLGVEFLVVGALMSVVPTAIQLRALRQRIEDPPPIWPRVFLTQISALPFVAAGALTLADTGNAAYWLVPGVIASLLATILNAWVLLVEILR